MKFIIYVDDAAHFLQGEYFLGVGIAPAERLMIIGDKLKIGEIDITIDKARKIVGAQVMRDIDQKIDRAQQRLEELQDKKKTLEAGKND